MNKLLFRDFILGNEEILMDKILYYAKKHNYTKYTSTLKEAWRLSIAGLSKSLLKTIDENDTIPEMGPDDDFTKDRIADFGIMESKKHRARGVTLSMFLGLIKYYQQAYTDLIKESDFIEEEKEYYLQFTKRYFDHVELGFAMEWSSLTKEKEFEELQEINRSMTNEKNKYLTVFESIYDPIILIDQDNKIENINNRAAELFIGSAITGEKYYGDIDNKIHADWLKEDLMRFTAQKKKEVLLEKTIDTRDGEKTFLVKLKKMLDISEKYRGTVIILYDITERKKFEKELKIQQEKLEAYAFTDQLTGVSNRRTGLMLLDKELSLVNEKDTPLSVCFIDIDGLKLVNDTYGHSEGDKLIKTITSGIQKMIDKIGCVSRMGGDEFLVIFPNCREAEAEKVMINISNYLLENDKKGDKPYQHSFSYGILEVSRENSLRIKDVLNIVDKKMYQQKFKKKSIEKN